jgi:hypothetical protein
MEGALTEVGVFGLGALKLIYDKLGLENTLHITFSVVDLGTDILFVRHTLHAGATAAFAGSLSALVATVALNLVAVTMAMCGADLNDQKFKNDSCVYGLVAVFALEFLPYNTRLEPTHFPSRELLRFALLCSTFEDVAYFKQGNLIPSYLPTPEAGNDARARNSKLADRRLASPPVISTRAR